MTPSSTASRSWRPEASAGNGHGNRESQHGKVGCTYLVLGPRVQSGPDLRCEAPFSRIEVINASAKKNDLVHAYSEGEMRQRMPSLEEGQSPPWAHDEQIPPCLAGSPTPQHRHRARSTAAVRGCETQAASWEPSLEKAFDRGWGLSLGVRGFGLWG